MYVFIGHVGLETEVFEFCLIFCLFCFFFLLIIPCLTIKESLILFGDTSAWWHSEIPKMSFSLISSSLIQLSILLAILGNFKDSLGFIKLLPSKSV